MVKERRSAADALALSPQIEEFIAKGITPTVAEPRSEKVVQMKTDPDTRSAESETESDLPSTESQETAGQIKKPSRQPERRVAARSQSFQTPDEMQRLLAKATVQKTVRFQPKLIAQMEAWIREQEARGENSFSFQQIQNEALKLWLEKNVS
jgi:hypothetical protein